MALRGFIESTKRILRIARKPTRERLFTSFKASLLGLSILGLLGFVIQLASTVLTLAVRMGPVPTIPREIVIYVLVAIIVVILGVAAYGRKAGWW
ncbi:MAG: protein translocase SEC61 complex subunit gamma [Thermoprotei archaeon]|nr:MAG: protein translocase SEC61 complex subunit gamma [Thermoprotei archaeon]RLE82869.1 MAG: protein translocase SEC61 complex subunit gamma [Thermoprotei archaeon]RLF01926.1 MAG: protein translocase SEC61 complex subunit gamma [Thermoprotei archaeon]